MLKYSTGRGKPGWGKESCKPIWWPEDIPWANVRSDVRTEEQKQRVGVSCLPPNAAQGAAGCSLGVVLALRERKKSLCCGLLKEGRDADVESSRKGKSAVESGKMRELGEEVMSGISANLSQG